MSYTDWPIGLKIRRVAVHLNYNAEVIEHYTNIEGDSRVRVKVNSADEHNSYHIGKTYSFSLSEMYDCFDKLEQDNNLMVMY